MALKPLNEAHALQIQAGIMGRKTGHTFEEDIAQEINSFDYPLDIVDLGDGHVFQGSPATLCLRYIAERKKIKRIVKASALSTGTLATSEEGKKCLSIGGTNITRCKSDIVITITDDNGKSQTIGVSTKQCDTKRPTNAQLYFTTARGFANLLQSNGIAVSNNAARGLRQFCGDLGFRPIDDPASLKDRPTDPRRFFWEEIDLKGRVELECIFAKRQKEISRLLLQKAYLDDPFIPDYLLHKTKHSDSWQTTEIALYSIAELIILSLAYQGFVTKSYSVKKGSYKDPPGITHHAPRFGIIQMQRGGQQQHPEQLQFNLEAGYFYKI